MSKANESVNWSSAVIAGVIATVLLTVVMGLMGMNIVKSLGMMILGPGAGSGVQVLVGGMMHLGIGIIYALIYAVVFSPVVGWSKLIKGGVFGLVITAIALTLMPVMATMAGGGAANNPCNMKMSEQDHETMSGGDKMMAQNPCGETMKADNPCGDKMGSSDMKTPQAANPCGAGNPCGGSGGARPFDALLSLINHLVYGLTLAFVYKGRQLA